MTMAANDDFPRGWDFSQAQNQAGAASITLPALIAVSHVLTGIEAKLTVFSAVAAAVSFSVFVNIVNGAQIFQQHLLIAGVPQTAVAGSSTSEDEWTWSGKFAASPGNALTVAFNTAAIANVIENLSIHGYDI